jgi:hypothetical protein
MIVSMAVEETEPDGKAPQRKGLLESVDLSLGHAVADESLTGSEKAGSEPWRIILGPE